MLFVSKSMEGFLPIHFLLIFQFYCIVVREYYLWNIDYQIFETSLAAWPFFLNVPFVFEKNVYSVFVGYRVLYMSIKLSIWCSNYPFPSLLFFFFFSWPFCLTKTVVSDSPMASMALSVHYVHFLFFNISLVWLSSHSATRIFPLSLPSVRLRKYPLFLFVFYTCFEVVFPISVLLVLTLKFSVNVLHVKSNSSVLTSWAR